MACWYHARRRFWEAAVAKNDIAREGLMRIGRIFELDEQQRPAFADQRGLVRSASSTRTITATRCSASLTTAGSC